MIRNSTKFIHDSLIISKWIPKLPVRSLSTITNPLVNVTVNDKTGIAVVSMNRKPVNGLNLELFQALSTTLDDLESNKTRGAILTSECATVFSAGLDLNELYKPDVERFRKFWSTFQDVWLKLYGSSFPTAAAINGHAPAGGCLLAISCEYRVMCSNYKIGLNETRVGLMIPIALRESLSNTISQRETEKALTLGTLYSTDEALEIGLVDEIANDKAEAILKCENFLLQFKNVSPVARSLTKISLRGRGLEALKSRREEDLQYFWSNVTEPSNQKRLGEYLQSLKKK